MIIATNNVVCLLIATLFASHLFWAPMQSVPIFPIGCHVIGWSFAARFDILVFFVVPLQLYLSCHFVLIPRRVSTTMVLINVAQMEITKHLSLAVMGVLECWVWISRMQ